MVLQLELRYLINGPLTVSNSAVKQQYHGKQLKHWTRCLAITMLIWTGKCHCRCAGSIYRQNCRLCSAGARCFQGRMELVHRHDMYLILQ